MKKVFALLLALCMVVSLLPVQAVSAEGTNDGAACEEHKYEAVVTAPTCTEAGYTTYTCSACGDSYTGDEVAPLGHTEVADSEVPATCTETGLTEGAHCSVCSQILVAQEEIPALGHSWDEGVVTKEPTEDAAGIRTFTCATCSATKTEDIPVLEHEHSYNSVIHQPTCTEEGYITYTCSCGDSYTEVRAESLGHSEVVVEGYAATCTEEGLTDGSHCERCGEVLTAQEAIPVLDHNYTDGICATCGAAEPVDTVAAPEIVSCYSKEQTYVKVTWTLVEGVDGYQLFRSTTPDDDDSWVCTKTVKDGTIDRYTNQGLTVGTTYYYKVRAYVEDAAGNRTYSDFSDVNYMPAAAVWDSPYSNATFRIRLRWNEISGAHGYQLWRQNEDGKTWSIVKTLGDKGNTLTNNQGNVTAYSNTGLEAGEYYIYRMRAFMITEDGQKSFGAYSDEIVVATMPETPEITVTSPKATRVKISWDEIHGAAGYQIWMRSDGNWSIVKSITDGSTSYTKYDLESGTEYQFKVRAYTEVDGKKTFGAYSEIVTNTAEGPAPVASGKCGDKLTWKLDDAGTLTISGTGAMYDYEDETPPWLELDVRKVVVESGVTTIGDCAFESYNDDLENLTEISLPGTLKEIGSRAFAGSHIQEIKIPKSVTKIGKYVFADSFLTSVTWSKGTKKVSTSAFERCYYLKEVVIPEGVTELGYAAFRDCKKLESVSLPSTLTVLEDYAFSGCNTLEAASLPDSVTTMESAVFEDCRNLEVVYLPQNLTTISYALFRGCVSLQAVLLPEKLTTIEANAFSGCDALVELYFPGTEEQLAEIVVYEGNEPLQYVTVYLVTLEE